MRISPVLPQIFSQISKQCLDAKDLVKNDRERVNHLLVTQIGICMEVNDTTVLVPGKG